MTIWRILADSSERKTFLRDWRTGDLLEKPFGSELNVKFACMENGVLSENISEGGCALVSDQGSHVIDSGIAASGSMTGGITDFYTDADFHGDITLETGVLTAPRGVYKLVVSAIDGAGNSATYAFGKVRII